MRWDRDVSFVIAKLAEHKKYMMKIFNQQLLQIYLCRLFVPSLKKTLLKCHVKFSTFYSNHSFCSEKKLSLKRNFPKGNSHFDEWGKFFYLLILNENSWKNFLLWKKKILIKKLCGDSDDFLRVRHTQQKKNEREIKKCFECLISHRTF